MNQQNTFSPSNDSFKDVIQTPQVTAHLLKDDGVIPNNDKLPLLVYQAALKLPDDDPGAICEAIFAANRWGGFWRNGIYPYHHYHSTAHEVLGICRGKARVQFGGEKGVILSVNRGDVVVIPAGVAHKNLAASPDLLVVGAYPPGQRWDLCYGKAGERPQALQNIVGVALPPTDPVYGTQGPLIDHWLEQNYKEVNY
jgi:uncharacterized protein YjlB